MNRIASALVIDAAGTAAALLFVGANVTIAALAVSALAAAITGYVLGRLA